MWLCHTPKTRANWTHPMPFWVLSPQIYSRISVDLCYISTHKNKMTSLKWEVKSQTMRLKEAVEAIFIYIYIRQSHIPDLKAGDVWGLAKMSSIRIALIFFLSFLFLMAVSFFSTTCSSYQEWTLTEVVIMCQVFIAWEKPFSCQEWFSSFSV